MAGEKTSQVILIFFQDCCAEFVAVSTAIESPGQDDFAERAFAASFVAILVERLQLRHHVPAHPRLPQQFRQRRRGGRIPELFQSQCDAAVVRERGFAIEEFELAEDRRQCPRIARAAEGKHQRIDRRRQVRVFGHGTLQDAVVPGADQAQPLEEVLDFFCECGLQAVEIGAGNFPGNAHCDPFKLNSDDAACEKFVKAIESRGMVLSALSVHGNPLHPDAAIARESHSNYRAAVELAGGVAALERERLASRLLDSAPVQRALPYLVPSPGHHPLHGSRRDCFENAMGRLILLGCRAGMPPLDEGTRRYRDWLADQIAHPTGEPFSGWYTAMVAAFLVMAGYRDAAARSVLLDRLAETAAFCAMAQDYVDLVHVSVGTYRNPILSGEFSSLFQAHGLNADAAETIKRAVKIPVVVVGGINSPALAEELI